MGLRYFLAAAIVLAMSPVMAWSQARLSGDAELVVTYEEFLSTKELLSLQSNSPWLDLSAALSINSDGKYGADIANFKDHQDFFHNYFLMESGFTQLHFDTLGLQLGRIPQVDPFGGPYSLFVNSSRPSALGAVLSYRDSVFSYESRWIQLNSRSNMGVDAPEAWSDAKGFPDRGANIKTLMFHVGDQTLGIQDAAVYTKRNFDLEYFVSPMPEYFTQYFYGTAGRPWTTSTNENNLIGFFWKLHRPEWNLGAQVLIDDFSLHFLLPSAVPNNPWKAAWTVGGDVATAWGTFGLHHAGALKYTFEPIDARRGDEAGSAYGYTFYPDTRYGAEGTMKTLTIEDNSLGYLHGENNGALLLTYSRALGQGLKVDSQLEAMLAGANSPANPWQDAVGSFEVGTHWLDDAVLQKSLIWSARLSWDIADWTFQGSAKLGAVWNALELQYPTPPVGGWATNASSLDEFSKIFKPSQSNQVVSAISLGVVYHWNISQTLENMSVASP